MLSNSVPKAGTHLLTQLLGEVPRLHFSGVHVTRKNFLPEASAPGVEPDDVLDEFRAAFAHSMSRIRNGQFLTAHLGHTPGLTEILQQQGFVHLLMIRDPRDIVVSRAFYRSREEKLNAHEDFAAMSDDDRLMAAITGLPATDARAELLPVGARFERHRAWLADPSVEIIRFEDLVGPEGGGSAERQHDAVRRVLTACRRDASDAAIALLSQKVFARHSATFRSGRIGGWREHLTSEHLAEFERLAPGALADLGYE